MIILAKGEKISSPRLMTRIRREIKNNRSNVKSYEYFRLNQYRLIYYVNECRKIISYFYLTQYDC